MRKLIGLIFGGAKHNVAQMASAESVGDAKAAYECGDYVTALRLWRPLADQGNARAQFNLGIMYINGEGVAQNYKEAAKWLRLAADQGIADAQYSLGSMYERGLGLVQDYVRAHMWYNLAASADSEQVGKIATKNRDGLAAKMTPTHIAQAQEMAKRCQQSNFKDCD